MDDQRRKQLIKFLESILDESETSIPGEYSDHGLSVESAAELDSLVREIDDSELSKTNEEIQFAIENEDFDCAFEIASELYDELTEPFSYNDKEVRLLRRLVGVINEEVDRGRSDFDIACVSEKGAVHEAVIEVEKEFGRLPPSCHTIWRRICRARNIGQNHVVLRSLRELQCGVKKFDNEFHPFVFRNEGDSWLVRFESETVRLNDSVGVKRLCKLVDARHMATIDLYRPRPIKSLHIIGESEGSAATSDVMLGGSYDPDTLKVLLARLREISIEKEKAETDCDLALLDQLDNEELKLVDFKKTHFYKGSPLETRLSANKNAQSAVNNSIRRDVIKNLRSMKKDKMAEHFDKHIKIGAHQSDYDPPEPVPAWVF